MANSIVSYLLLSLVLIPTVGPLVFRLAFKLLGLYLASKSRHTRSLLLEAVKPSQKPNSTSSSASSTTSRHWRGVIGFFHPFCNAGGGGERVLWAAIRATQETWPQAVCVVYTGDHDADKLAIIRRVREGFNISLNPNTLHFFYISTRKYVLPSFWPHATLAGQSLGSLMVALDAFSRLVPDIYIDTMGYAYTLALSKLLFPNVPTAAYVHYPTISTDMLSSLDTPQNSNQGVNAGAGAGYRGKLKRKYWQLFAKAYSLTSQSIDVVMTNSSWTRYHIQQIWGSSRNGVSRPIHVVYPPVAVTELEEGNSSAEIKKRSPYLLYVAQFRPEKNHTLIINAFAKLLASKSWPEKQAPNLILVGSIRDEDDTTKVYNLRLLVHALQLKEHVEFVCDASWSQLQHHLRSSSIGVNGMWNEHFGIGVVEYQASGLISVVNNSGGPKLDIVVDIDGEPTGYHASTEEEYTAAFLKALSLNEQDAEAMRSRARKSALRFSDEVFAKKWTEQLEILLRLQMS